MEFNLKWQKNKGLDPAQNPAHSEYLSDLCDSVVSVLQTKLSNVAQLLDVEASDPVYQEVLCHGERCKEKIKGFVVSVSTTSYKIINVSYQLLSAILQ